MGPASPAKLRSALLFEWLGFEALSSGGMVDLMGSSGQARQARWLRDFGGCQGDIRRMIIILVCILLSFLALFFCFIIFLSNR